MNAIAEYLKKDPARFTRFDIVRYMEEHGVTMLNFRYVGGDGRLKTLNFVITSREQLEELLTTGERVDGSSLFAHVEAANSDLYVVPRFCTAFLNPFTDEPTVDLLCSYYTYEGVPLANSPENLLRTAARTLRERTGYDLEALGELEFYLFSEVDPIYGITEQRGYHESHPFSKWELIRREAMKYVAQVGGRIKYGHAEVGNIIADGQEMVQHEIEFLPCPVEEAADQLVLAKWVIREVAYRHGLIASFAPKIIVGHAGSGLHIHSRITKDGANAMTDGTQLSEAGRRLIAGYLRFAPSLCAFGNTVPTSFLRLVPHQEAPTTVCWGDRNRSALVRVPLGWLGTADMLGDANPAEPPARIVPGAKQTVEIRSPDGSAQVHSLLAALCVAARWGLEAEEAPELAAALYVAEDVHHVPHEHLHQLPTSCAAAADELAELREEYEAFGVFPPGFVDHTIAELRGYEDRDLSERFFGDAESLKTLVHRFLHVG